MQTVEEYLNLSDWVSSFRATRGTYKNYDWLGYSGWADALSVLDPETTFYLIMTRFDCSKPGYLLPDGQGQLSDDELIWRVTAGDYLISPALDSIPSFSYNADSAFIAVDRFVEPDAICEALEPFEDRDEVNGELEEDRSFWEPLKKLNSLFYYAGMDKALLASREGKLIEQVLDSDEFKQAPVREREFEKENRRQEWALLGPENGPELCIEEGCKRKRISLAVRCFMHQKLT